ncbi:MAG: serine/threonine-protein kinase [Myxococcota bacterium]
MPAPESLPSATADEATGERDEPTAGSHLDLDEPAPARPPTPRTKPPGTTVDKYIVLDQLGAGGMGVVYSAYDPTLDRKIALKVLHRDFGEERDPIAQARLLGEGRALARVNHRNVVIVFDVGSSDGEVYVAMELVDGQTLKQWREQEPHAWPRTVEMFVGIAAGLQAVHAAGLVHRDVKPDNVLIDRRDGQPRVTDFGLARPHTDAPPSLEDTEQQLVSQSTISRPELTRTGARLGTPAYMSCEQLRGQPATAKSDQFSLCVALWECLYGIRPYAGHSLASRLVAMTQGPPEEPAKTPSGRPVPAWLRHIVLRGLSLDPADRWPSVAALGQALAAGDPHKIQRRVWGGLGAGVLALGAMGAVYASQQIERERARAACADTGAAIEASWTPKLRAQVEAGFVATGVEDADSIAEQIVGSFDAFTRAWADERRAVCMARLPFAATEPDPASGPTPSAPSSPSRELVERRIACLDARRATFETLVETFTDPDDVVVKRAQRSAEGLASLAQCQDERRLANMPALPEDPTVRQQVREIDAVLAKTLVHEHVGRYHEGLTVAQQARARAQDTGHRPLLAQAHYRVAVFLEKQGEYDQAVDTWAAAFREATLAGDEQQAAEAASALAFTEGYQLERHDTGIRWAELSGLLLERLGSTRTLTEATRLDVLAVLREMKGDYERSIATHHKALALRRQLVPAHHHSIGYGLANLAGVLRSAGQLERAKTTLVEALSIFEAAFGPSNPTTAHVLSNLAGVQTDLGNYAQAEALLARVESIWSANLRADHPDLGDVHNALGEIRRYQGHLEQAAQRHRDALTIHQKSLAPGHPTIARSAYKLGHVQWLQGDLAAAEDSFRVALETLRKADEAPRDDRGRARHGLAQVALARGRTEQAAELFAQAQRDFESHGDGHPHWVARTRLGTAATQILAQQPGSALPVLAELTSNASLPRGVQAPAFAWQARALAARGDEAGAMQARDRAANLAAEATADLRAHVGKILHERADASSHDPDLPATEAHQPAGDSRTMLADRR